MNKLTHTSSNGKAQMVDVGAKPEQLRVASAIGHIKLQTKTIALIQENNIKKGDVLTLAEVAGIQAAKLTSQIIPLCHNIFIDKVSVNATLDSKGVKISSECRSTGKTGIEMEALTAVSAALLTVYDMCKAVDNKMIIGDIELIEKIKHGLTK